MKPRPFSILILVMSCTQPADFSRDNPADPQSSTYVIAEPEWITVYPYGTNPRVSWGIGSILPQITIERQIGTEPWTEVATVPASDSPYLDTSVRLYAPITYRYRLHAHNAGQRSDTLTSWPNVVSPEITLPIVILPESYPSLWLRKQLTEIHSTLKNDTLFVSIRQDTLQVERRIGDAPFEIVGTTISNVYFHDLNMTDTGIQYRFTPRYMGRIHDVGFTTPYLDRYLVDNQPRYRFRTTP